MLYELRVNPNEPREGLKQFDPRNSRELRKPLKTLDKARDKLIAQLAFDGKFFSIETLNCVAAAKAEGKWPGITNVNTSVVIALAMAPPPSSDPIIISCDGDHLRFGSLTVGCTWQSAIHTLINMPAAPDWVNALSLNYRATGAKILSSGYQDDIQKAEHKLDKLIKKVTESLAPLNVSEPETRAHKIPDTLEINRANTI